MIFGTDCFWIEISCRCYRPTVFELDPALNRPTGQCVWTAGPSLLAANAAGPTGAPRFFRTPGGAVPTPVASDRPIRDRCDHLSHRAKCNANRTPPNARRTASARIRRRVGRLAGCLWVLEDVVDDAWRVTKRWLAIGRPAPTPPVAG